MAKAGADLIGLNCLFGPFVMLDCMKVMKDALDKEGLKCHLMCQPLGYRVPDAGHFGWINIPEFPYALEPRQITRIEAAKYARAAYDMGIRYIGGCCGFEPYHIRAMAEELSAERGKLPEASKKTRILERVGTMYWKTSVFSNSSPKRSSIHSTWSHPINVFIMNSINST